MTVPEKFQPLRVAELRARSHEGDMNVFNELGVCYEKGIGTSTNIVEAVKWYTKAKENGHKKAAERLQKLGKQ
jgi:TPR repeat protein